MQTALPVEFLHRRGVAEIGALRFASLVERTILDALSDLGGILIYSTSNASQSRACALVHDGLVLPFVLRRNNQRLVLSHGVPLHSAEVRSSVFLPYPFVPEPLAGCED